MLASLLLSALLMGLAGTPHCLAMCGAPCAAVTGSRRLGFHLGRLLSYSLAGAVAAASIGSLASLGQAVAALRPLWTLLHVAALTLGLWLLWQGRQPAWMEGLGRARANTVSHAGGGWQAVQGPARSTAAGLAWVAWPCGLLQSALLVAALANGPWQGALVMAVFAAATALGLVAGPVLWWRLAGQGALRGVSPVLAVRVAGLALAGASAWALSHDVVRRVVAWCLS